MEGAFLLEFFEPNKEAPEFALCFLSMDIILDYIRYNIKDLTDEYIQMANRFAAKRPVFERQSLDDEKTLRVSYVPFIRNAKNRDYNRYITGPRAPTEIVEREEIREIPAGSVNAISAQEIHNQDKIVDFDNSIMEGKYVKLGTFRKLDERSLYKTNPWTRGPIDRAVTYRARIAGRPYKPKVKKPATAKIRRIRPKVGLGPPKLV
jgi:hypothetical protein